MKINVATTIVAVIVFSEIGKAGDGVQEEKQEVIFCNGRSQRTEEVLPVDKSNQELGINDQRCPDGKYKVLEVDSVKGNDQRSEVNQHSEKAERKARDAYAREQSTKLRNVSAKSQKGRGNGRD